MENQKQAYTYALTAVLFWSTVASAFKISLRYLDFLQLLFYSSIVSIAVFFVVLLIQKKLILLKTFSKTDYLHSAFLGFLNPFLYYVVLLKAYSMLPAQEAQALNYTWGIAIALLSIPLLKQKIKSTSILALIVSFVGVVVIGTRGDLMSLELSDPLAVSLAVGSSGIWALFWIFNTKDKRDEVTKLFLNFTFGFIFILIATLIFSTVIFSPFGLFGATYVGIFEMGITFVIWLKALKFSKTTAHVSNLIYLSPFLSLVFIYLFVGEQIMLSTVIGLILIVVGIFVQQFSSLK
ncbi:MAG: DMT family transporter [Promethearchaeota archaeon]